MNYKYTYHISENKVICLAKYAGKAVRGIAKCNPEDKFDVSKGKTLARLRCEEKLHNKRVNNAARKLQLAEVDLLEAKCKEEHAKANYVDCLYRLDQIKSELADFEKSL